MRTHFREPDDFTQILEVTPATREAIGRAIDHLIALLDQFDQRHLCDGESEPDPDDEENGDLEPSIGTYAYGYGCDMELDESDREPALGRDERDGQGPVVGTDIPAGAYAADDELCA